MSQHVMMLASEAARDSKGAVVWDFREHVDFSTDVVVGLSPTNYHCYVVCDDVEFHPRFSFNRPKIRSRRQNHLRAAAVIQIRGLAPERVKSFKDYLVSQAESRSPSCHMGVIRLVREGLGLEIPAGFRTMFQPSSFLSRLFNTQSVRSQNSASELECRLFLLRERSPEEIVTRVRKLERSFMPVYVFSALFLLGRRLSHWILGKK